MVYTFKRGIHPNEQKEFTENVPTHTLLPAPGSELIFPLSQHLGAPCAPLVKVGQKVLLGEKIGDSEAYVCAPIHSSVSGTVKDIRPHLTVAGTIVNSIIIENDGELKEHEDIKPRQDFEAFSRQIEKTLYPDQQVYLELTDVQKEIFAAVTFIQFTLMKNGLAAQAMDEQAVRFIADWESEAYRKTILR